MKESGIGAGTESTRQSEEIKDMELKTQILSRLLKILILKKMVLKWSNKLNLSEGVLEVESVHFRKNNISLQKGNRVTCGTDSFLQRSMVYVEGANNSITIADNTEAYDVSIRIFGEDNQVIIGKECTLRSSEIIIEGNHNKIIIGENFSSYNAGFHLGQDNNEVCIGSGTTLHGRNYHAVHFELYEGSRIIVGTDCMFSNGIQIHSSDSHSIVDLNGKRLNPAEDIIIGSHCWIGFGTIILKGTHIPEHTVVGAGTVCTQKYKVSHCILAGNPARIVKEQIDWDRKFL